MDLITLILFIITLVVLSFIWLLFKYYSWNKHNNSGVAYLQKRDFDNALREFKISENRGKNLDEGVVCALMNNLAVVYQMKGMKMEAGTYYNKAAMSAFNMGKYEKALSLIEKTMEFRQDDSIIFQNYGDILLALKRNDDALEAYDRAIRWGSQIAHYKKAIILFELGRGKEAFEICDTILKINPNAEGVKDLIQKYSV